MKKNLILTAILSAMLFTACGNDDVSSDTASSETTSIEAAVTLNSITEMTLLAAEPDVQTTSAHVSEKTPVQTAAEVTSASGTTPAAAVTTVTAVQTQSDVDGGEYEIYEAIVLSNSGTYIAVELLSDSFFGAAGDEAHIYGEFDADAGEFVHISFLEDEVEVMESYPPEIHCPKTQVIVFEYAENYDLPYDSGEEITEYEYAAKVNAAGENFITIQLLEDTFFGKTGDEVVLKGFYDLAADEIITFIISEDAPVSGGSPKQIAEKYVTVKGMSDNASEQTYSAEVTSVSDGSVCVKMQGDAFFCSDGAEVYLNGSYDVSVGDVIEFTLAADAVVAETVPPIINEEYILNVTAPSYYLEITAIVKEVYESRLGGYNLVVNAYALQGYPSPVPLSLYSEVKYEKDDELIVVFAEGTVFMETSPLHVNNEDVLSISKS